MKIGECLPITSRRRKGSSSHRRVPPHRTGGNFTTTNGIRVAGNAGESNTKNTCPIKITVNGGTFDTTDPGGKYRVHDIAFQKSSGGWESTKESTSYLRSYVTANGQSCTTAD